MAQPHVYPSDPDEQRSFLEGDLFAGIAPTLSPDALSGLVGGAAGGGGHAYGTNSVVFKCTQADCSYGCTFTTPTNTSRCLCSYNPNCSRGLDC
jgi:hypothetical protein